MKKKQPTRKRLPSSFVLTGAAADLFPDETSADKLFFEIAVRCGIEEAERIFTGTIARAKKALPRGTKSKGAHDRVKAAEFVDLWKMWSRLNGANKQAFAAWYLQKWEPESNLTESAIVKRVQRLPK